MSGTDKIHKSMVMELDSIQLEAGPGGYISGELVSLENGLGIKALVDTDTDAIKVIGIADETKLEGETGSVRITGTVVNPAWSWTPGAKIWADPNISGGLTETGPASHLFVGTAISSVKIALTLNMLAYIPTEAALITGSGSVNVSLFGEGYKVVPTGNIILNLQNPIAGRTYVFKIVQTGVLRTISFANTILWLNEVVYAATDINTKDIITIYYDGEDFLANFAKNYGV